MTNKEFKNLLDAHDWDYSYSDDHSVYTKGSNSMNKIMEISKTSKRFENMLNNYINTKNNKTNV